MDSNPALNERQERFCQQYVYCPVGRWAAIVAGYDRTNAGSQACRLLAREDIQARIAQLRHVAVQRQCRDADAILAKLQSVFELAVTNNRYNTAVNALALQARIAGLLPGPGGRAVAVTAADAATEGQAAEPVEAEPQQMPTDANQSQPENAPAVANGDPAAPEPQDLPPQDAPGAETAPMPTKANECQSADGFSEGGGAEAPPERQSALPGHAVAAIPAPMPTEANQCESLQPHQAPETVPAASWPSGGFRRTRSGRRK